MDTSELILYIKRNILRLHEKKVLLYRVFQPEPGMLYVSKIGETNYVRITAQRNRNVFIVTLEALRTGKVREITLYALGRFLSTEVGRHLEEMIRKRRMP